MHKITFCQYRDSCKVEVDEEVWGSKMNMLCTKFMDRMKTSRTSLSPAQHALEEQQRNLPGKSLVDIRGVSYVLAKL